MRIFCWSRLGSVKRYCKCNRGARLFWTLEANFWKCSTGYYLMKDFDFDASVTWQEFKDTEKGRNIASKDVEEFFKQKRKGSSSGAFFGFRTVEKNGMSSFLIRLLFQLERPHYQFPDENERISNWYRAVQMINEVPELHENSQISCSYWRWKDNKTSSKSWRDLFVGSTISYSIHLQFNRSVWWETNPKRSKTPINDGNISE